MKNYKVLFILLSVVSNFAIASYSLSIPRTELAMMSSDGHGIPGVQFALLVTHEKRGLTWCGERPPYPCVDWDQKIVFFKFSFTDASGEGILTEQKIESTKSKLRNAQYVLRYDGVKLDECKNLHPLKHDINGTGIANLIYPEPGCDSSALEQDHGKHVCHFAYPKAYLDEKIKELRQYCLSKQE